MTEQPQHARRCRRSTASGRRSSRPRATRSSFNEQLFARHRRRSTTARATAGLTAGAAAPGRADLRPLRPAPARSSPPRRRRSSARSTRSWPSLFTDFGNKVLADENTWVVLDKPADLAGLPDVAARVVQGRRRRAQAARASGSVVNTRSSVDPFLTVVDAARPAREGVEGVQEPRRQRRRRTTPTRRSRRSSSCAPSAPTLLGYATHAHWRMANTMAVDPAKAEELMMRVWPAAVARVSEEVADMQKIARQRGREAHDRAVGLPLLRREGAQGEVRPRPGRAQAVLRAEQHDRRRRSSWPSSSTA